MDAKNKLVAIPGNLTSPDMAKPEDFPVKTPKQGMMEGMNQLVKAPESPTLARGEDFKPMQSKAEEGTKVKCEYGVDFVSGDANPNVEDDRTN